MVNAVGPGRILTGRCLAGRTDHHRTAGAVAHHCDTTSLRGGALLLSTVTSRGRRPGSRLGGSAEEQVQPATPHTKLHQQLCAQSAPTSSTA